MPEKWRARLVIALAGVYVLALLMAILFPAGNSLSKEQIEQIHSDSNLHGIAYFVLKYRKEYAGRTPASLKDLAGYTDGYFEMFYAPTKSVVAAPDISTNVDDIDKFAAYVLVNSPSSDILVYEKPGLWQDGTVGVCPTDGTVRRFSTKDFEQIKGL